MNDVSYASFALDIPILLPLLGAFTVLLASRKLFGLKVILWAALGFYMSITAITLVPKILNNPTWPGYIILSVGALCIGLWLTTLFLFCHTPVHVYRKRLLWTLNSFMVTLFWALSGSLYVGYLDVPDFLPEPIRSLIFANSTPEWLIGPTFMWNSGTELLPIQIFFILIIAAVIISKTKKWIKAGTMWLILIPTALIFFPYLQTGLTALIMFALYPVSLVYLGVTKIGYTLFGSFEKETGFFGNMENSTGVIPPPK